MHSSDLLTILLAIIAACGATLATGLLTRPKMRAEAKGIGITGDVAMSGEARAWAKTFADQASAADKRAERAEQKATNLETRFDEIDVKFDLLVTYTRSLQAEIVRMGGHPPPPPPELIPPL
jgi:hypothetical protein